MTRKTLIFLAATLVFMWAAVALQAQQTTNTSSHHMRANNMTETASGCLEKSSSGNGYTLTAQDGNTWQLSSDAVDLGTYTGKQVSVAGTKARHSGHIQRVSSTNHSGGHHTMDVLDLTVLHEHCQQ